MKFGQRRWENTCCPDSKSQCEQQVKSFTPDYSFCRTYTSTIDRVNTSYSDPDYGTRQSNP